jgi:hypothetical protein
MTDRPTAPELLDAVRGFLERELLPTLTDARQRFRALVAANVLGIVARELARGEDDLRAEWRALSEVLGEPGTEPARSKDLLGAVHALNTRLCERIRTGAFDELEDFRRLARVLREQVLHKLEVNNPRHLRKG